jgi:hypothetical protein
MSVLNLDNPDAAKRIPICDQFTVTRFANYAFWPCRAMQDRNRRLTKSKLRWRCRRGDRRVRRANTAQVETLHRLRHGGSQFVRGRPPIA